MSKLTDEFEKWLPTHQAKLSIIHNPQTLSDESADDFISFRTLEDDFASAADRQQCIDTNEIWVLTWFPETRFRCHSIIAPTLEKLLLFARDPRFQED